MTVAELGSRMSSAEFADWLAFQQLEQEDRVDMLNDEKCPVIPVSIVADRWGS